MKKSLLLLAVTLVSIVCQAQLIPVSKLNLKTGQAYLHQIDPKTKQDKYFPGVKSNVTGSARIDYVKEGNTTWLILQASVFNADPFMYIIRSTVKKQHEDGSIFYNVDAESIQGQPTKFVLMYKNGQLIVVNIISESGYYRLE